MSDRIKNAQLKHQIPLGALVELGDGVRLRVVEHARDCDLTPLYTLAVNKDETIYSDDSKMFYSKAVLHGWPERHLVEVKVKSDNAKLHAAEVASFVSMVDALVSARREMRGVCGVGNLARERADHVDTCVQALVEWWVSGGREVIASHEPMLSDQDMTTLRAALECVGGWGSSRTESLKAAALDIVARLPTNLERDAT